MDLDLFHQSTKFPWYVPVNIGIVSYVLILFIKNIVLDHLKKIAKLTTIKADDICVEALEKTRQFFIIVLAVYIASHFSHEMRKYQVLLDRSFTVILMLQFWIWGREGILRWIHYTVEKKNRDASVKTTLNFVGIILNLALVSTLILLTLSNFGYNVSTVVAGLGIGGVAIALATKNLLEDLFSSLSIVLDKPFLVGDYVSFGEWEGVVEYIGLKTTQIRSINGELILVSNSQMLASKIRNFKRLEERRVSFNLEVELGDIKVSDISNIVQENLSSFKIVRFERLSLVSFTSNSASYEMVYWVETSKYKTYTQIHNDVLQKLKYDLDERGIKASAKARV